MRKFVALILILCPFFVMAEQNREDELKKLDWLVGQWVDKDDNDDVELSLNYAWDEHKNFLINEFSVQIQNKKDFSGTQYITWDPVKKAFHSWMFDSDGSFGQGDWKKKDDKWIVTHSQTLPNGDVASGTSIYKKLDQDSYSFQSVGRMVNGEMLPDIDEVTVVRKK